MKTDARGRFITTRGPYQLIEASEPDPNAPAQHIDDPLPTITTRGPGFTFTEPLRTANPTPGQTLPTITTRGPGSLVAPTFLDPSARLRSIDEPIGETPWWFTASQPPAGWGD